MSGLKPQERFALRSLGSRASFAHRVQSHSTQSHTHPGIATHPDADPARRA